MSVHEIPAFAAPLLGGVLIGIAVATLLLLDGRVAGISGIVAGLARVGAGDDVDWRLLFIAGLLGGGLVARVVSPTSFDGWTVSSLPLLGLAGGLVGLGTRIAGGCTSGHGVCGLSRLSTRSIVATMTFMGVAAATVFCVRHGARL
jgi:uncharacterized membrane protein YedE/YeeE